MRGKIARLEEALDCAFVTQEHAAVLATQGCHHRLLHRPPGTRFMKIRGANPRGAVQTRNPISQLDAVPGTGGL